MIAYKFLAPKTCAFHNKQVQVRGNYYPWSSLPESMVRYLNLKIATIATDLATIQQVDRKTSDRRSIVGDDLRRPR